MVQAVQQASLYAYYHTHWDREWYLPFREYQFRLLSVVDTILDTLEANRIPCFTLDGQTVLLEDYLEFRPENRARLEALVRADRLSIGPWYVMPDEFLVSGESLIRNLQRGFQISESYGEKTFTGYLPDTFGHSADIPMILRQFGVDSAIVWRGVSPRPPLFRWIAPSGESVLTYHLTQGYFQNTFHMGHDWAEKAEFYRDWMGKTAEVVPADQPILFPVGADHLGMRADAPEVLAQLGPDAQVITPDRFMAEAGTRVNGSLDSITGELRDEHGAYLLPGVFSSRMYLKQWNRKLEWRFTRQLEQLLVWSRLLGHAPRFAHELDFLWKTLLLNHPHDSICGCSVDSVHRENEVRFEQLDQLSGAMVREAHHRLCGELQPDGTILLLNLGDTEYSGPVRLTADYSLSETHPAGPEKHPAVQVLSEETVLDERYLRDTDILPLSENLALRRTSVAWVNHIPSHGFRVISQLETAPDSVRVSEQALENKSLRVEISPEGGLQITDKRHQRVYAGIHQLWRNAEQGDSYNAAPVPGVPAERAVLESVQVIHPGPLHGAVTLSYRFQQIDLAVQTEISLQAGQAQLEFRTRFVNQTPDHKIQVVFQTAVPLTEVCAEGHFAPIIRDCDPDYRIESAMPAPSQEELRVQGGPIQRFIGFDNQTLLTEGLTEYEVEGDRLKLTLMRGFGMLSRNDTGVRGSHAGPPLPTPEGQCLNRPFDCRYAWSAGFEVTDAFHAADRFYGAVYGFDVQQSEGVATKVPRPAGESARSFFTWDNPAIQATAMVPDPDSPDWVLRLLNPTDVSQSVQLKLQEPVKAIHAVDLRGRDLGRVDPAELTLLPYRIQTFRIQVK